MKIFRWLLCVPLSAIVAIAIGFWWSDLFRHAFFSYHSLLFSIRGLSPLFFGRLLPVGIFVILGALIAPARGRKRIAVLGLLGGVFGWPFGPRYEISLSGPTYYAVEVAGAICGAAVGMTIAFLLWPAKDQKEPTQTVQTPTSGTSAANAPVAPPSGAADR
jgi:hypothetical protein